MLLADDGTTQTKMLYGFDPSAGSGQALISQDNGSETRLLLTDGLGSVRVEMTDDAVASATTYEPFGNILQQTGTSGTAYGFTGEQHGTSSEQLYLRARYYNPALHTFMSKDPWSGNGRRPQSMNGWSYVDNNPVNFADPTGLIPFPEDCRSAPSYESYGDCVREAYEVSYYHGDFEAFKADVIGGDVPGPEESGCYEGPVPYRAPGYLEGHSLSGAIVFVTSVIGRDLVYDFASMERNVFIDSNGFGNIFNPPAHATPPALSTIGFGASYGVFIGGVTGFRNWRTLNDQYVGDARFTIIGGAVGSPYPIGISTGLLRFRGMPDSTIVGNAWYGAIGAGITLPLVDAAVGVTTYSVWEGYYENYDDTPEDGLVDNQSTLFADIRAGIPGLDVLDFAVVGTHIARTIAIEKAKKYAEIYEGIHYYSYMRNK